MVVKNAKNLLTVAKPFGIVAAHTEQIFKSNENKNITPNRCSYCK